MKRLGVIKVDTKTEKDFVIFVDLYVLCLPRVYSLHIAATQPAP